MGKGGVSAAAIDSLSYAGNASPVNEGMPRFQGESRT
jgi:hypothetical protein